MTIEVNNLYEQLAQEILSTPDIKIFYREHVNELNPDDMKHLKSMVDQLSTVDFNRANRLAEAIWQLGNYLGDDASIAYAEAALGRVEYCYGHYTDAHAHYEKAIIILEKLDKIVDVAILQKQLVGVLMYLGKHEETISLAARAARILKANGEKMQLAELETNIGNLHCYLRDQYRKALRYYERARKIFISLNNEVSLARLEHNIANAYTNLDRIDEALILYERAAQTYRQHGMDILAGQAAYNTAYLLFRRGEFNQALKYYYKIREEQKSLGDEVSVAWCNLDLAELYLQLKVYEESARLATEAQKVFLQSENRFKAAWAQTLKGIAFAWLGKIEYARKELYAALEEFSRNNNSVMMGFVHTYLSDLEMNSSNYQTALTNIQEAENLFEKEHLSIKAALARLSQAKLAYLTGNFTRAHTLLNPLKLQLENNDIPWMEYECCYLRGCLYEKEGELKEALAEFTYAIEMTNKMGNNLCADELKSAFLRDKLDLFDRTIELILTLSSDCAIALKYVEQAKSRSLSDLLAHYMERELAGQLVPGELRERFHLLLNELYWYNNATQPGRLEESIGKTVYSAEDLREKRSHCQQELNEIFRRIQIENSDFADLKQPTPIELPELQQLLNTEEIFIEYFTTHGQISAFIITRNSIFIEKNLISEDEIEQLLAGFRFQLRKLISHKEYINKYLTRFHESIKNYLKRLHALLIAPLEKRLAGKALIIVPHGLLHYIPFQALHNGSNYLIEEHDISYAPSMTVYVLCQRKKPRKDGALLILGVPDQVAPEITDEIEAIQSLSAESNVLIGKDATMANLRHHASHCRVLHLATHGVVRHDNPLFSYLKLCDGELTFYNTYDLKLEAELVTLSACNTGVNHIFPGDELHGLMRGFLYAGTPSMVVSLWEVNDHTTSKLMMGFYQRFLAGESKRSALCAIQREMLHTWQHPYYWAAFNLIGTP